jgi:hypothetical protein
MGKKISNSFNFLGYAPNENLLDPAVSQAKVKEAISTNPDLFKSYYSEELFRPKLEAAQREKQNQRLRNIDVNSFNQLAKKAGYDETYGSNLYNRVMNLSNLPQEKTTEAYTALIKELSDLKEQATTNTFTGVDYLADFTEGLAELSKGYLDLRRTLFKQKRTPGLDELLSKPGKELKNTELETTNLYTPSDIYNYAKKVVDRKNHEVQINKFKNQLGGTDEILNLLESKSRNLKSTKGFDDLLMPYLDSQFTNPGSEFYREVGSDFNKDYVEKYKSGIKSRLQSDMDNKNIGNYAERNAKYDLEKESLNTYKSILSQDLTNLADERRSLIDQKKLVKDSPEDKSYQKQITRMSTALDKLVSREKGLDDVYGVSIGERSGFLRGLVGSTAEAIIDLSRFSAKLQPFNPISAYYKTAGSDVNFQFLKNALYKPEVLKYDKFGNPVMSNQIFYESASGSQSNWSGFFESGGAMIGDMVPAILIGGGIGRVVSSGLEAAAATNAGATIGSRALISTAKAYDKLNRYGNLQLANRISTFGTVYGTVKERIYDEEKKWGGDAEERSIYLALSEATAEALGFPDVGPLKINRFSRGLGAAAKTATNINLSKWERTYAALRGGKEFAKTAVKANLVESFEEEMALLGETLVSEAYAEQYDRVGRDRTEFNLENVVDTFTESFKGGLLYSGLMTGRNHYRVTRKDALLDQAEYEAALNPELFKAKLKEIHKKNPAELSEKQLGEAIVTIDNLSNTFKGLSQVDNLKSLNTFFDDEDARRKLFTLARRRENLAQVDLQNLSDEDLEEFAKFKFQNKTTETAAKQYTEIRKKLAAYTSLKQEGEFTPEQATEFVNLQAEALKLRAIAYNTDLSKLSKDQLEFLTTRGLIQDKDFQFTQADLDKMINDVNTDILKTEKRAFEYAALTKEEKAEKIKAIYNEKIKAIEQVTDPTLLFESYVALKKDYEYLEKNVLTINPEILANKQTLLDAYASKFDSLTQPNASGINEFERMVSEVNIEEFITQNNIYELLALENKLNANKDHIDVETLKNIQESIILAHAQILNNINKLTGANKITTLAKIMEDAVKLDTITYYDQAAFEELLISQLTTRDTNENLQVRLTPEEFEQVRAEFIAARGIKRSESITKTGRVDNISVPVSSQVTDDVLRTLAKSAEQASSEIDETGTSEKSVLEKEYSDNLIKGKNPQEGAQALKDRVGAILNPGSARANSLQAALDNYLNTKDLAVFNSSVQSLINNLQSEIEALRNRDRSSKSALALEGALSELKLWQKTVNKLIRQNPATNFNAVVVPAEDLSGKNLEEEFPGKMPIIEESDFTSQQIVTKQAEIDMLDKEHQRRRRRLIDLTSPARSNGIETKGESNDLNTDPVVRRRVAFIDELATTEGNKMKVMNKRQFIREFLAAKFPNKDKASVEADMRTIQAFFNNLPQDVVENWDSLPNKEAILAPVFNLIGNELFDVGQINYYVKNKGEGLLTNPEVIMVAADSNSKILLSDNYPLELSFVADSGSTNTGEFNKVPWKLSRRIQDQASEFAIRPGDLNQFHQGTHKSKKAIKSFLEKNDSSILMDFEISEGVITKGATSTLIAELPEDSIIANSSLADFVIPTDARTRIGDKIFKFNLGRLYYNNDNNPVILNNTKLSEDEINAIAELVFSTDASVIEPSELDLALFNLINQIDKDNRIVFFPSEKFQEIGENGQVTIKVNQLLSPSIVTSVDGKRTYKKLDKEEFIKELGNYYYKVSPGYLTGGENFGQPITRFEIKNGKPNVYPQPYLEYIKETHEVPVNSDNEIINLVNKVVYLDSDQVTTEGKVFELKESNTKNPGEKAGARSTQNESSQKSPIARTPSLTRKVSELINIVAYDQIDSLLSSLGFPNKINYSEEIYNSLVAAVKANPSIMVLNVASKDPQRSGIIQSEYLGSNKGVDLLIGIVTLNNKKYPMFLVPGSQESGTNLGVNSSGNGYSLTSSLVVEAPAEVVTAVSKANITEKTKVILDKLNALNQKRFVVNPENKDTYIQVDSEGKRVPNTPEYDRISNLTGKKEFLNDEAADRGTLIDGMFRLFIDNPKSTVNDFIALYNQSLNNFTNDPFTLEFLEELHSLFSDFMKENPNLNFISTIPTLWGSINNKDYAGTIDLLAIDNTNGKVYIIDLKTSTTDRTNPKGRYFGNYQKSDQVQQSGYAELFQQRTGIVVDGLFILPIQVFKEDKAYVSAKSNKVNSRFIYSLTPDNTIFKPRIATKAPLPTIPSQETQTGPATKGFMSVEELQAAADQTPQKRTQNTPTKNIFSNEETNKAQENTENCKTGSFAQKVGAPKTPTRARRK